MSNRTIGSVGLLFLHFSLGDIPVLAVCLQINESFSEVL